METITIAANTTTENDLMAAAKAIGPFINQFVDDEEKKRRISPEVLDKLREAGFFKLYLPESLGGIELSPVTTAKLIEEISLHNTAAGWSMMVANTATWWSSRVSDKGIEEIFKKGPDTFLAGAFHPPMNATPVEGGYKINGRSPLASNVHEGDWIFVTAFVMDGNNIKLNNGIPEIIGVHMKPGECRILDTWYTIGMKATDSNDVAAENVFVPHHLSYAMAPEFQPNLYFKGKLYKYAAIGASIASLIAPVALAVALNALKELKAIAEKKRPFGSMVSMKDRSVVQRKLGMAEALVQSGRAYLYKTLEEKWNKILEGEKLTLEDKTELLLAATHTNQSCVQAVDLVYSAAGTSAIYTSGKLAHYFADAQVIRQHGFINDSRYETAGQVYLGLQPDLPVLVF